MKTRFKASLKSLRQKTVSECGLVCLDAMWRSEGLGEPILESLRKHAGKTSNGLSLADLGQMAEKLGMQTMAVKAHLEQLSKHPKTSILFVDNNHFVLFSPALYGKKTTTIFDPAKGIIKLDTEELLSRYSSKALIFISADIKRFDLDVSSDDKVSLISLMRQMPDLSRGIPIMMALSAITTITQMIVPVFIQIAMDRAIPTGSDSFLISLALVFVLVELFNYASGQLHSRTSLLFSTMAQSKYQSKLLSRYITLPYKDLEEKRPGDTVTDFDAAGTVTAFATGPAITSIINAIFALLFSGILFLHHTVLATAILTGIITLALIRVGVAWFERPMQQRAIELGATSQNEFFDVISSIEQIKLFNVEGARKIAWQTHYADSIDSSYKLQSFRIGANGIYRLLSRLFGLGVTTGALYAVIQTDITIGVFYLILQYRTLVTDKLNSVVATITQLVTIGVQIDRFSYLAKPNQTPPSIKHYDERSKAISVAVEDLTFSYGLYQQEPILKNINMTIKPGEKVLLLGGSGSGKTTLLKIMMGLLTPDHGQIQLNHSYINAANVDMVRQYTAGVFQGQTVSAATIKDNIQFYDDTISDDIIYASIQTSCLKSVVGRLPMQLETMIGPNFGPLSTGEKQRVLLARAAAKMAPLTFFDEGTSNLDAETEQLIVQSWIKNYPGTLICTAHHADAYKNFDSIYRVENGNLIREFSGSRIR